MDYKHSGVFWDDSNVFYPTPKWTDFSFEFEYNGKQVFVNRYKGTFYDDYQLDEIEQLCTLWLQEKVDERIVGFKIDSSCISNYEKITQKGKYYIISENDIEDFLNNFSFECEFNNTNVIYYYDEYVDENSKSNIKNEIQSKAQAKLTSIDNIHAVYLDIKINELEKKSLKTTKYGWINILSDI
jgi:hypothetical protein